MTRDDLARMSRDELIDLALADYAKLQALKAEVEALKMKLEKGKKHRHGPPQGHAPQMRKFVGNPEHVVEIRPQVCKDCQGDLSQESGVLVDVNLNRQRLVPQYSATPIMPEESTGRMPQV